MTFKKLNLPLLLCAFAILVLSVCFAAYHQIHHKNISQIDSDDISESYMLDVISHISEAPRPVDSQQLDTVSQYLQDELSSFHYNVTGQEFHYTQKKNEAAWHDRKNLDSYLNGAFTDKNSDPCGTNIIAEKKGTSDRELLITAHYDSGADTVGANDNGSGVAVLLQTAKLIADTQLPYTVKFIFFSGEESWLLGSRYYVGQLSDAQQENILGVINVDTVAEKSDLNYWVMVGDGEESTTSTSVEFQPIANNISDLFTSDNQYQLVCAMNSDHYPFSLAGIPAISIVQDLDGGSSANSPKDTMDILDPARLVEVSTDLVSALKQLIIQWQH